MCIHVWGEKQAGISIIYVGIRWEKAIKTANMMRLSKENGAKSENLDIKSIWQAKDSHCSFVWGKKKKMNSLDLLCKMNRMRVETGSRK